MLHLKNRPGRAAPPNIETDFFDTSFTFFEEPIQVGCCSPDKTVTNVTCGLGASCAGQCSAIDASLCPSSNCTGNPEDCRVDRLLDLQTEEDAKKSECVTSTCNSEAIGRCAPRCPVKRSPHCCYNPVCHKKYKDECCWLPFLTGND